MGRMTRRGLMAGTVSVAATSIVAQAAPGLAAPSLSSNPDLEAQRVPAANAWLEISRSAFRSNLGTLRAFLDDNGSKDTEICAVMKADMYGHGISILVKEVADFGGLHIGFAGNEEARVIRALGSEAGGRPFTGRLIRLRMATIQEIGEGIDRDYNIEELIGNLELAKLASAYAVSKAKTITTHICLNSGGMSRNGLELSSDQGMQDLEAITRLPNLNIVALMTHFPAESDGDVAAHLAMFRAQTKSVFSRKWLSESKVKLHVANSYTTLRVKDAHLDMVRVGGALIGDTVDIDFNNRPTAFKRPMTFKSRVASINFYRQGDTVSYDRTRTLTRDSFLANIPVGYSDGYRRDFSNLAYVLINGHRVPIVGRVTMNTTMVDVTDYVADTVKDRIKLGDQVVLFGKDRGDEIGQGELEGASGALGAEFTTVWGELNPRIAVN